MNYELLVSSFLLCGTGLIFEFVFSEPLGLVLDGLGLMLFLYFILARNRAKVHRRKDAYRIPERDEEMTPKCSCRSTPSAQLKVELTATRKRVIHNQKLIRLWLSMALPVAMILGTLILLNLRVFIILMAIIGVTDLILITRIE
jgi:hypothetical protein